MTEGLTVFPEMPDLARSKHSISKISRSCFHSHLTRFFTIDFSKQTFDYYMRDTDQARVKNSLPL